MNFPYEIVKLRAIFLKAQNSKNQNIQINSNNVNTLMYELWSFIKIIFLYCFVWVFLSIGLKSSLLINYTICNIANLKCSLYTAYTFLIHMKDVIR